MAVKTFSDNTGLPASDINLYLANAGLDYIKEQTVGTAVSSVEITSAFSSTYDNYNVTYNGGVLSGVANIAVYMGNAALASLYYGARSAANPSGTSLPAGDNNVGSWANAAAGLTTTVMCEFWFFNPQLAVATYFRSSYFQPDLAGPIYGSYAGLLNNGTQYTSFTMDPAGAVTMTGGIVRVYGYRKA